MNDSPHRQYANRSKLSQASRFVRLVCTRSLFRSLRLALPASSLAHGLQRRRRLSDLVRPRPIKRLLPLGAMVALFLMTLLVVSGGQGAVAGISSQPPVPIPTAAPPFPPGMPPVMPPGGPPVPPIPEFPDGACTDAVVITGVVVDPTGNPVQGAYVSGYTTQEYPLSCAAEPTGADGSFELAVGVSGMWVLQAWGESNTAFPSLEVGIEVGDSGTFALAQPLSLTPAQVIGQLLLHDGIPAKWATAIMADAVGGKCAELPEYIGGYPGGPYPPPYADGSYPAATFYVHADENGHFSIGGYELLVSGTYCIYAQTHNYGAEQSAELIAPPPLLFEFDADAVATSGQSLDLGTIQYLEPIKVIAGTVNDQKGEPAAGIQVQAYKLSEPDSYEYVSLSTLTDDKGQFEIFTNGGDWEVTAWLAEYLPTPGSEPVTHQIRFADDDTPETLSIDFSLTLPTSTISAKVEGPDGPIPPEMLSTISVYVHFSSTDDAGYDYGYFEMYVPLDEEGRFTTYVNEGIYGVQVSVEPYSNPGLFGHTIADLEVSADTDVDLGVLRLSGPQVHTTLLRPDGSAVPHGNFSVYNKAGGDSGDDSCQEYGGSDPWYGPLPVEPPGYTSVPNGNHYSGISDESGLIQVGGLAPGAYCLQIGHPWNEFDLISPPPVEFTIVEDAGLLVLDPISLVVPPKEIQGQVRSQHGDALPYAGLSAFNLNGNGYRDASADEEGNFVMSVGPGTWEIRAYQGYGSPHGPGYCCNETVETVVFKDDYSSETQEVSLVVDVPDAVVQGRFVTPDGEPLSDTYAWVNFYTVEGFGTNLPIAPDGTFSLQAVGGQSHVLELSIDTYVDYWDGQVPHSDLYLDAPITVLPISNETLDLGDIVLSRESAIISGSLQDESGAPVAGVAINAWGYMGGWESAITDADGLYQMRVRGGTYELTVAPDQVHSFFVKNSPAQIDAIDDQTVTADFIVQVPSATVVVHIQDPEGNVLADVNATAYIRRIVPELDVADDPYEGGPYGMPYSPYGKELTDYVINGLASFEVPEGEYAVGVYMDQWADYSFVSEADLSIINEPTIRSASTDMAVVRMIDLRSAVGNLGSKSVHAAGSNMLLLGEQRVSINGTSGEALSRRALPDARMRLTGGEPLPVVDVAIVLQPNDAVIAGHLRTPDGEIITDVYGDVYAWSEGIGTVWSNAEINPTTGAYTLTTAAGPLRIDYYLSTDDYVPHNVDSPLVTAVSGEVTNHDIVLTPLDSVIEGTVLLPTGEAVEYGYVWASTLPKQTPDEGSATLYPDPAINYFDNGSEVIDGRFSIRVVSGMTYTVGTDAWHWVEPTGTMQADVQEVYVSSAEPVSLTLQFRNADAVIAGTVYRLVEQSDGTFVREAAANAWVNGWSEHGHHGFAESDADGRFELDAFSNTTVHLTADWYSGNGYAFYTSAEDMLVTVNSTGTVAANIDITLHGTPLPATLSQSLDVGFNWSGSMTDGTRLDIPAGAIPVENVAGTDASVSLAPVVGELPDTLAARPLGGYGYSLNVFEQGSLAEVNDRFNTDVTMTLYYSDGDLEALGITEDEIAPAYYSEADNSWIRAENFVLDPAENKVTVQVRHAADWALVAPGSSSIVDLSGLDQKVFVPLTQ